MRYKTYHRKKYELIETTNLNPCGKDDQHDDIFQVLTIMRPDLTREEVLKIITSERIRRAEMSVNSSMIARIMKETLPEYKSIKLNKKYDLLEVLNMFHSGKTIIRMGSKMVVADADCGKVYTGISELYTMRPVAEYWRIDG